MCKLTGETITLIPPKYWFPILDPEDGRTVTAQVLAWLADPDENGQNTALLVEIHTAGQVEKRRNDCCRHADAGKSQANSQPKQFCGQENLVYAGAEKWDFPDDRRLFSPVAFGRERYRPRLNNARLRRRALILA